MLTCNVCLLQDLAIHISRLASANTSSMLLLHIMVDMFHLWNQILKDHGWVSIKGSYTVASSRPIGCVAYTYVALCTHAHAGTHGYMLPHCLVVTSPEMELFLSFRVDTPPPGTTNP